VPWRSFDETTARSKEGFKILLFMPHMLGNQVSEQIRAIKPDIEVVFMSGYARRVLTSQGMLDPTSPW
jgi:hypothetical protein